MASDGKQVAKRWQKGGKQVANRWQGWQKDGRNGQCCKDCHFNNRRQQGGNREAAGRQQKDYMQATKRLHQETKRLHQETKRQQKGNIVHLSLEEPSVDTPAVSSMQSRDIETEIM